MMILFKDGHSLQVESISAEEGALHVNVISGTYAQLKRLFTDPTATAHIEVTDNPGETYDNYTVFSYIKESGGGVFTVEMFQQGVDVNARLTSIENENSELKKQNDLLTGCVLEMSEEVYK